MAADVYLRYGFRRITEIDKSTALGLLNESPHLKDFYSDKLTRLPRADTIIGMKNMYAFKSHIQRLWIYRLNRLYWLAEEPKDGV
jgi:hypothetical protein